MGRTLISWVPWPLCGKSRRVFARQVLRSILLGLIVYGCATGGNHVVPQAISKKVVQACHGFVHGGVKKTFVLCDRKFYFQDTDLCQF